MTDLIDRLAGDLKPVRPLDARLLWAGACVFLIAAAFYVGLALGLRHEVTAVFYGYWPANPIVYLKPLIFLVCGLSALWAVAGLTRPEGRLKLRYVLPVLAMLGAVTGNLMSELARQGTATMAEQLNGGVLTCFSTILVGGLIGLSLLWYFWLRRAATSHPVALGAMSGLAAASLMAAAYALHCTMDAPVYIFAIYTMAVTAFTAAAALFGGRMLKW